MTYQAGQKIGHWTLMQYLKSTDGVTPSGGKKNPRWVCRCVCGMVREVQVSAFNAGLSKSCGCQTTGTWKRAGLGRIVLHAGQQ